MTETYNIRYISQSAVAARKIHKILRSGRDVRINLIKLVRPNSNLKGFGLFI